MAVSSVSGKNWPFDSPVLEVEPRHPEARSAARRMAQFPFESQAAAAGIWRKGHWYSWVMKNVDSEVLQI